MTTVFQLLRNKKQKLKISAMSLKNKRCIKMMQPFNLKCKCVVLNKAKKLVIACEFLAILVLASQINDLLIIIYYILDLLGTVQWAVVQLREVFLNILYIKREVTVNNRSSILNWLVIEVKISLLEQSSEHILISIRCEKSV